MASKNMLVDLNLNGNELQKAVIQNLAAAPANPKAGQIYYNTVDQLLYTFNGTEWVTGKIYSAGNGLNLNGTEFSVDTSIIAQKSDIGNGILTIQKNGNDIDTFAANSATNKTINVVVPTEAADVNALPDSTKYGSTIEFSINSSTYVLTAALKDQDGNVLGTAQTVDLPLESVVVSGAYDNVNKKIILTLQDGSTIDVPVADLVAGLQAEITPTNKLSADLVDDSTATNKFVTAAQKALINTALQPADIVGMARKASATNPELTASGGICTWVISNTLATAEVVVSVYDIASGDEVYAAVTADSSSITIKMNSSADITAGIYKAVIVGQHMSANSRFLNLDTDGTLSANSDQRVSSQKAIKEYVDSNKIIADNKSITKNTDNEIQTVGVIDQNTSTANKFWTGTKAEYDAIVTKDPNTTYRTTDEEDEGGGGSVAETTWFNGVNGNILNTGLTGSKVRVFINGALAQPGQSITTKLYKGGSGKSLVLSQTAPLSTAGTWSIKTRVKWVSDGNPATPCVYAYSGTTDKQTPCLATAGQSHLGMFISSNGSSWNIDDAYYSQLVPQNGVVYDFETKFTGTNYQFLYSTDFGKTWKLERNVQNSAKVFCNSPFRFLNNAFGGNYYNNSVLYMSATKITVDDTTWFDGATAVEGTDYVNDGCTLTEAPSSTNDYYYNQATGVIVFSKEIVNGTVAVEHSAL